MKARIKKTGEIVNISEYARITLEQCDSWGNPIEVKPEDIELIQEITGDEHWQNVKERAAIAAMQAMLSCGEGAFSYDGRKDDIAKAAFEYANALVAELKKE